MVSVAVASHTGEPLDADLLTVEEFEQSRVELFKYGTIQAAVCGHKVHHVSGSHRNRQHFSHYPHNASCPFNYKGESLLHIGLKAAVAQVAVDLGFDVLVEQRLNSKAVADVLITDGENHVVIEPQLSRQARNKYVQRTDYRTISGTKTFWLTPYIPHFAYEGVLQLVSFSPNINLFEKTVYLPENIVKDVELVQVPLFGNDFMFDDGRNSSVNTNLSNFSTNFTSQNSVLINSDKLFKQLNIFPTLYGEHLIKYISENVFIRPTVRYDGFEDLAEVVNAIMLKTNMFKKETTSYNFKYR